MRSFFLVLTGLCFCLPAQSVAAPPTVEQVNSALDVAAMAAKSGLPRLSLEALQKSLGNGPPTVSTISPDTKIFYQGARINTSIPVPKPPLEAIRDRIPDTIFRLSTYWKQSAQAKDVYLTLRDVVLPPGRSTEAFLYSLPMKVSRLQPNRMPATESVAQALVLWAKQADLVADLHRHLEARNLKDSPEGILMVLLIALELRDREAIDEHSARLLRLLEGGTNRRTAEMVAFVGMNFQRAGHFPKVAAELLHQAGLTLAGLDLLEPEEDSPARAVLLAAARSRFALSQKPEAVELLKLYLTVKVEGKYSASSPGLDAQKLETVGRELYRRGMVAEARDVLGQINADAFERRYRAQGLLGQNITPATTITVVPPSKMPATLRAAGDIESRQAVANEIWFCALDTEIHESKLLFTLPDFQSAASLAVSPDGSHVAFDATFPGEAITSDTQIFIASLDGASIRSMGRGTMPSWSPEGKRLAYSRYSPTKGIWITRAAGADAQLLDESGWSAQWSPDGRMIAYVRQKGGRPDLVVYDIVEDEFFSVFEGERNPFQQISGNFGWSPDGMQLAFKATMAPAGSNNAEFQIATVFVFGAARPFVAYQQRGYFTAAVAWTLSGRRIVCSPSLPAYGTERLHYLNANRLADPVYIQGQEPDRRNSGASWMPDGKTLLYMSRPVRK
ncbi:MAG TPA: hypothetical protein EYG03_14185 [Planctomycetes bacterium]|nr:hypothetical protein [Planctomycetota bacterium]